MMSVLALLLLPLCDPRAIDAAVCMHARVCLFVCVRVRVGGAWKQAGVTEPRLAIGVSCPDSECPSVFHELYLSLVRAVHGLDPLQDRFETSFLARQPLTFLPSYETFAARPLVRND